MVISIILAKGSSNRIHKKNLKEFCGRPLFLWSVLQSINSRFIDSTYVSTDDTEIADLCRPYCHIIRRPHEYTLTPANHANVHALDLLKSIGIEPDQFVCLLPTSPVRLPWDIDNLITYHHAKNSDITATVCEKLETIVYERLPDEKMRIKVWDKKGTYYCDGGGMSIQKPEFYRKFSEGIPDRDAVNDELIAANGSIDEYMYIMKEWQTPELDAPDHWLEAEAIMDYCILRPYGRDCYEKYGKGALRQ